MTKPSIHTNRFLRLVTRALVIIPITGLLMAPTCDQSFNGDSGSGSDPEVVYRAFGDSIAAGNVNSGSGQMKSYVGYFADDVAAANGWFVTYDAKTVSGETTSMINSTMNANSNRLAQAEILTFNGGGNDLIDARSAYASSCNQSALANDIADWRDDWDNVINTVDSNVQADALIRTMNIYYPDPNNDKSAQCSGQRNHFEVLLPHGLAMSHYMCASAEAMGWSCVDVVTVMNCEEDANGNPATFCPNKDWSESLAAGACPPGSNGMMDHSCIRDYLDSTGDWAYFQDPSSVLKGTSYLNLIQGDDVHPNAAGHDRIGAAHHDLGYADCGACPQGPVPPACGDGVCNGSEDCGSCPGDCGACATCGDGVCNGSEDCGSCASDCGACVTCGDGVCNGSEDCGSCASDCGACVTCGDGVCNGSEDCGSCADDCGTCGGSCTNTCHYAGDGECDDGGPGSDYSICALGTDCADCGPR